MRTQPPGNCVNARVNPNGCGAKGLRDIGDRVVLILDSLFQHGVIDRLAEGDDGSAAGVADLGGCNAVHSLQSLLDGGFAMTAHHAFDFHRLFHFVFLLMMFF